MPETNLEMLVGRLSGELSGLNHEIESLRGEMHQARADNLRLWEEIKELRAYMNQGRGSWKLIVGMGVIISLASSLVTIVVRAKGWL